MSTCPTCRVGTLKPGTTTLHFAREGRAVVISEVPARVCDDCGEALVAEPVAEQVADQAEAAFRRGAATPTLHYQAA